MVFELKHLATPVVMAIGKETSKTIIFNDSPLTGVKTPGSDENSMKRMFFDVHFVLFCCQGIILIAADHRDPAELFPIC